MSLMARQVAAGSKTLGLHIKQHEDVSEAARQWAQELISEGTSLLQEAHGHALEEIVQSFRSAVETLRQDSERSAAQLLEQGQKNAGSLQETASQIAESNETLLRALETAVRSAETAITQGAEVMLKEYTPLPWKGRHPRPRNSLSSRLRINGSSGSNRKGNCTRNASVNSRNSGNSGRKPSG